MATVESGGGGWGWVIWLAVVRLSGRATIRGRRGPRATRQIFRRACHSHGYMLPTLPLMRPVPVAVKYRNFHIL